MNITDEQIIEVFKETRSPSLTAERLGVAPSTLGVRLRILRAKGVELPKALRPFERGDAARQAGIKGGHAKWKKYGKSKNLQA